MIGKEELEKAFDARFPETVRKKLQAARVAVAGLGGLGSNIAVMLTRCGVGHLFLVDFDVVDMTNLNRQAYRLPHLGRPKTEAIREILAEINPYVEVETLCVRVTGENAAELFGEFPIVCEAFDKPENKAMLISTILKSCPGTTVISGNGMAGYGEANGIRTARKLSRLYVCGDGVTEASPGVGLLAPRVADCAGHQANQAVRLILGEE